MKKYGIIAIATGSLFVVLLAVVLAIRWPGIREGYAIYMMNNGGDTGNGIEEFSQLGDESEWARFNKLLNSRSFSVKSDTMLFSGEYRLPSEAWSPDGGKFYVAQDVGGTDIGLPEYTTYSVFVLSSESLLSTGLRDSIVASNPLWKGNSQLATEKNLIVVNDSNVNIGEKDLSLPDGYELLEDIGYVNPNDGKFYQSTNRVTLSHGKDKVAFLSSYMQEGEWQPGDRLFVLERYVDSLDDLIDLGQVSFWVESSYPPLMWAEDDTYLISGRDEIFDVRSKNPVVGYDPSISRNTILSKDQTMALIVESSQDRRMEQDYLHRSVKVYVLSLKDGSRIDILDAGSSDESKNRISGSFSPDNSFIIYNFGGHLWIADTKTGASSQVTDQKGDYFGPIWAPQDDKVVYQTRSGGIGIIELQ